MAGRPGWTPPLGTNERIRSRAIWAVAMFAASVPPAVIGAGPLSASSEQANVATPLAFAFWIVGMLFASWTAIPTLRYWDALPTRIRLIGALPLLCVSLSLTAAMLAAVLA